MPWHRYETALGIDVKSLFMAAILLYLLLENVQARPVTLVIDSSGATKYRTLQSAINALPTSGGEIVLRPGIYREKVAIGKRAVHLRGDGNAPQDVTIVWSDGAVDVGGTLRSATLDVSGEDFQAHNLTIQNDYSLKSSVPSQAVALAVTGDRAVFEKVRLLGAQDTLYAASSSKCGDRGCRPSRQYFKDCYIEGHVDFIFGDAKAYFEDCEIHAIAHAEVRLTAQSKSTRQQDSAYVFEHCRITSDPGARHIYLGRPWRDYATVIFLDTQIEAPLEPAGWSEWTPGKTTRLETAYFAEYASSGPGANLAGRDPHSHQLTTEQSQQWSRPRLLSGHDGWTPWK